MTEEQEFSKFLDEIDLKYADYLRESIGNIRKAFLIYNGSVLRYVSKCDLREDIKEKVILKHIELYGDAADFEAI